jgi:hypothetical protein
LTPVYSSITAGVCFFERASSRITSSRTTSSKEASYRITSSMAISSKKEESPPG